MEEKKEEKESQFFICFNKLNFGINYQSFNCKTCNEMICGNCASVCHLNHQMSPTVKPTNVACSCKKECKLKLGVLKQEEIIESLCCTRNFSQKSHIKQPFYNCLTCSQDKSSGKKKKKKKKKKNFTVKKRYMFYLCRKMSSQS